MEILRFVASLVLVAVVTIVGMLVISGINCDSTNNQTGSQVCENTKVTFYAVIAVIDIFALIEGTTGAISAGMSTVRPQ